MTLKAKVGPIEKTPILRGVGQAKLKRAVAARVVVTSPKSSPAPPARPTGPRRGWAWPAARRVASAAAISDVELVIEVLEVDILWPRWVARIGVTRATEACFLTADRQCTELPLLRLPRLVPEVVGCDPFVPRDLARVGWRGARCREGLCKKPIPVVCPAPPHRAA